MTIKNVTITSKNQITLPTEYVTLLQLAQNRVLQAELRNGQIVLSPQPDLTKTMQQFWGKHSAKQPLSEAELNDAVRSSAAIRASKAS
jgi:bifunctional DNA-binding transcriptional regulator/antitoxin component of YhaV-PrlF toxin-antitoxin module